ncbi:MAG: T9SS type A sorting domain-containing protein, partial [Flavobacteriales bacterium]|nr:T9SS type A sorting domain-containing protein [Flavobacteriales bacterium]
YTHGTISSDTGDLDGSEGVYNTNPDGAHPFFCARYNEDGELNWAFGLYGGEDDWATDIHINGDGQLVVAGLYQEDIDLDPGSGETMLTAEPSTWPLFVASYNQGECAAVSMEITSVEDLSCADMTGYIEAQFNTGSEPYQYLWNTSEISAEILPASSGIYWVTGTDANGCTATRSVLVNGPTTGSGYDLNAHLTAWSFIPGFETMIALDGLNAGCESTDGTFTLVLDPTVNFVSADPTPDAVVENTLTWNYADLAYGDASITPMIWVFTPADTELETLLNFTVTMDPVAGDFNAENNSRDYSFEVIGSYDPNIKEVYPAGTGAEGFISNNQLMTYTVHFQNTGSAPAVNVYILDEIDPDLDLSTIQVVGSSHAMTTEVLDNNTLKFNFANIQLPDSTNNEPESHGYVIYTIMQQPDLTPFTEIENTASIYFDFNEPVITNTVLNTIASPDFVPTPTDEQPLQLFPNPTDGTTALLRNTNDQCFVSIYTSEGKLCRQITAVGYQTTLNLEDLPAGMYTIGVNENRVKLVIY